MQIRNDLTAASLQSKIDRLWELSGEKIRLISKEYDNSKGTPVFTVNGKYTLRGWTEWTQGFQYGAEVLQFDATGDESFLESARKNTVNNMASHVSHFGVHDHGFNNVSTYGNLLRLMNEGRIEENAWERNFYEVALKVSGSVQAHRWTSIKGGQGFIHSFNGPHSLFVDTIRSVRALMVSHLLGHSLMGENDVKTSLLERGTYHSLATAKYSVFYGEGRDSYDLWGRTAHESVFNTNDGNFRCPNSQQGFSGFTTWTRGLAWAMTGFAEQLESLSSFSDEELASLGGRAEIEKIYLKAAKATCDFYIDNTAADGIPYWDTGAPQLYKLGDYTSRVSDPYNEFEPIDSSATAIGAQGLLRLGKYLNDKNEDGSRYWQAGLTAVDSLFAEPYLSTDPTHQGLILHSIYHQPNGWDNIPAGQKIACGESSMWGDYHAREVALYLHRINKGLPYYAYLGAVK
ncbi:glycoside hydrolase family 88 protein [Dyadobacter psychrotolerans]|uniref:Glycosyl hydrolase n=1 Tax=Dyadobacter psychrotolerans TaxID=2541721 RepID=A0A4R5DW08_9BACT|nr:glycoside hydrolase family 88 protein [Dyadobacter psychrotolerans]TDE18659.1 glycosyl hydrolase [Dyadobacter psychrotolerans]